jgi:glycosyltransferase involved in cell wall biosynthesis
MKRVLHVMGSLERSGMETMLLSSYEEWLRLGYECDVVATGAYIGNIAREISDCGYRVFHIPFRNTKRFLPRLGFIAEFFGLCRMGYDIVHIHRESGRPAFAILARLAGVRTIAVTPHNVFNFHGLLHLRKFCERQIVRLLGCRFGMISESVRQCEWNRFRIRGIRISNWLDTSRFRPASAQERESARLALGIAPEDFVVVSVGNCSRIKNHTALLRAIAMLSPSARPLYLHIGCEEQELAERELAAELGIADRVRFLGSQADPLPFLWAADVFAMPSFHEGLSISAIEAAAAGVPLIFSHVDGLSDIAAATKWTVLTATTPDSIAGALARVRAMQPFERQSRALSDSQMVRERFSMKQGVRSIVEGLYA